MRKLLILIFHVFLCLGLRAQTQTILIDSIKAQLAVATTDAKKVEILSNLCRSLMNENLAESDKYGQQMMEVAEMSRDRKLMVKALLANGERYSYLAGRKENIEKAIGYYNQGLELARKNSMDEEVVKAYLMLSEITRNIPDADKALGYCNQAYSFVGVIKNDSISARVYLEYGSVYFAKNEKLLALRNYMAGIRLAEDLKNNSLLRAGYSRLSVFYAGIEEYDKAIDYQVKAMQMLDLIKTGQSAYNKVQDLTKTGDLYGYKKSYDMAMRYYEKALAMADSLKYDPIKALVYRSIVNNYLFSDQPQKALQYFNEHPQLKTFLENVNFGHFIDQSYGFIYAQMGKYDSAKYYYNKVANIFENSVSMNKGNQYGYYYQLGLLHKKTGENNKALEYFTKAREISDGMGQLAIMASVVVELDSLYQLKGDYKQALYFSKLNHKYKDSLDKLGQEKDLMQLEVADEQQRQDRLEKEQLEAKRKRNNIQYLLITIGIVSLFVLMVTMGMFKVSANTIKMVGFFAFLMFFEFIFLIFKKNIYGFTNGEPWKDLAFMIGLAAILLPLHHWLEHKVIHYLTSHNRLTASGRGFMDKILKRRKKAA
ncbi:MAG: tetratricopeptide repeat protein [Bacteroidota bacterium]